MKKIIAYIFILFTIVSCTKEVEIDIPGFEEKLVIDGRIETGQPPVVLISHSRDIYSPTDLEAFMNSFVSGAVVTVSDGTNTYPLTEMCTDNLPPGSEAFAAEFFGVSEAEIASYHLCAYVSLDPSSFGQVGKTYTLNVSYDGQSYSGSTQILTPTALDSVFWKPEDDLTDWGYSWARLSDPIGSGDAYHWEVKRLNHDADGNPKDNGYKTTWSPVFDDEFIEGKTFDFFYENPMSWEDETIPNDYKGYYHLGDTVVIKFSKIDPLVYEFLEKKHLQIQTNGNPFATPTNVISNLSGGCLGVFAGYSPTFDTLIIE